MYKGQIKDFPQEIVEKMLERQVDHGNVRDVSVFEHNFDATTDTGGFSWAATQEGHDFWNEVLFKEDFDLFFKRYPKQTTKETQPMNYRKQMETVEALAEQLAMFQESSATVLETVPENETLLTILSTQEKALKDHLRQKWKKLDIYPFYLQGIKEHPAPDLYAAQEMGIYLPPVAMDMIRRGYEEVFAMNKQEYDLLREQVEKVLGVK